MPDTERRYPKRQKFSKLTNNTKNLITIRCRILDRDLEFLIDSDTDISICKLGNIKDIEWNNMLSLSSITMDTIESIGTAYLSLRFRNALIRHEFHLVEDNFLLSMDGIIGRDIFEKYRCNIDFDTYTTTFEIHNEEVVENNRK